MNRISVGWQLTKKSWAVLRNDKSLMWFPILAGIFSVISLLLLVGLAAGLDLSGILPFIKHSQDATGNENLDLQPWAFVFLVVLSYISVWLTVFFNTALASCAVRSMQGEDTTVREGIRDAWARKGAISAWALIVCTVGMILRALEERLGFIGTIIAGLLGLAWGLITLFAVPVIALEGLGPWATLKRSAHIFKERWGESLTGRAAISIITSLAAILVLSSGFALALVAGMYIDPIAAVVVAIVALAMMICISIIFTALTQTFNVAMYAYSASGAQLGDFQEEDFQRAFKGAYKD